MTMTNQSTILALLLLCLSASPAWPQSENTEIPDGFIYVPGGKFLLGSPEGEGEENERPQVEITLSGFYVCPTEVTYAQMALFALDNGLDPQCYHYKAWGEPEGQRVAIGVSWFDAIRYANWRSLQTGLEPAYQIYGADQKLLSPSDSAYWDDEAWVDIAWPREAKGYRLPTEAEWEYAARGGQLSRGYEYAGANDLDSVGWNYQNSEGKAHVVSGKQPNELGIFDMSGNAWEWCFDVYRKNNYAEFAGQSDPVYTKYEYLRTSFRCVRGGSWLNNYCRSSNRGYSIPRNDNYVFGFRLFRTP